MTVFENFHFVTGTDPFAAALEFGFFVGIKVTGAKWTTCFIDVLCKAVDDGVGDVSGRMRRCPGFFPVLFRVYLHSFEAFFCGFGHDNTSRFWDFVCGLQVAVEIVHRFSEFCSGIAWGDAAFKTAVVLVADVG